MDEARVRLSRCAGLPVQGELHARQLLLRKGRYHELRIRSQAVLTIIRTIGELAASPEIRINSEVLQKAPGVQSLRAFLGRKCLETHVVTSPYRTAGGFQGCDTSSGWNWAGARSPCHPSKACWKLNLEIVPWSNWPTSSPRPHTCAPQRISDVLTMPNESRRGRGDDHDNRRGEPDLSSGSPRWHCLILLSRAGSSPVMISS